MFRGQSGVQLMLQIKNIYISKTLEHTVHVTSTFRRTQGERIRQATLHRQAEVQSTHTTKWRKIFVLGESKYPEVKFSAIYLNVSSNATCKFSIQSLR